MAPSKLDSSPVAHRELTGAEIEQIILDFGEAARRAKQAGFDAVQLHGAHGYLMTQFLSPKSNLRTDNWGGSPENRRRFHIEVMRSVKRAVGPDYPVWMKLGLRDYVEGGLSLNEGIEALRTFVAEGLGAVEVSAGMGSRAVQADGPDDSERSYFRAESREARAAVDIPIMLVGGIRSLTLSEDIVSSGDADMVSMSRPFIREPDIVARWQRGDTAPAKCISCAKCLGAGMRGGPLRCEEQARVDEETVGAAAR